VAALSRDQIAKLRAEGKSVRQIAAERGVSTSTVYRWADPRLLERQNASARRWRRRNPERMRSLREAYLERAAPRCSRCGRPLRAATPRPSPVLCGRCRAARTTERRRRVAELFARGAGTAEIAAQLGPPRGTVAKDIYVLRALGELPAARPQGFDSALERQLIALYEDGWPLQEIARSLGRDKRTITRQLARLRADGAVGRRTRAPPRPPAAPPGFTARAELARELGFESMAGMRGREQRIASEDPELVAREWITLTGHDGQRAVFYGPALAARVRARGPRRPLSRRNP
jgi:DNA-binding NarL/FixJ family response regulator